MFILRFENGFQEWQLIFWVQTMKCTHRTEAKPHTSVPAHRGLETQVVLDSAPSCRHLSVTSPRGGAHCLWVKHTKEQSLSAFSKMRLYQ